MKKNSLAREIFFAVFAVAVLIYLLSLHQDISDEIKMKINKQQEDMQYLESVRDELVKENESLEYRKLLFDNDKEIYYETILREDFNIQFFDETVYPVNKSVD